MSQKSNPGKPFRKLPTRQVDRRRRIADMPEKVAGRLTRLVAHALGERQVDWLLGKPLSQGFGFSPRIIKSARTRGQRAQISAEVGQFQYQRAIENVLLRTLCRIEADFFRGQIDLDWAGVFFDLAKRTENPGKQDLWAGLLAREISQPGAVPVVALRRLYEFSGDDLALFSKFAPWVINNFVVRLEMDFFEDSGVDQNSILYFEELGLLRTNRDMSKVFQSQSSAVYRTHILYNDVVLRIASDDVDQTLTLPIYRLSEAGVVLAHAIQREATMIADREYVLALIAILRKRGFTVQEAAILEQRGEVVARHSDFCEMFIWPNKPPVLARKGD